MSDCARCCRDAPFVSHRGSNGDAGAPPTVNTTSIYGPLLRLTFSLQITLLRILSFLKDFDINARSQLSFGDASYMLHIQHFQR